MLVDPAEQERRKRRAAAAAAADERDARASRLKSLNDRFLALHRETDAQRRGYAFEKLLKELCRIYELEFDGSYKTDTDQIDGALEFESFTYLIEARWRKELAADAQLGGLSHKVERRIHSTRGLLVSMAGFRSEAVALYRLSKESRLILMDGQDLTLILEGRIELPEALRVKVRAAALEGEPLCRLANL